MGTGKSDPVWDVSDCISDLYVGLEDFTEEGSTRSLLKVLVLLRDLRTTVGTFERCAIELLRRDDVPWSDITASLGISQQEAAQRFPHLEGSPPASGTKQISGLVRGHIYTRNDLRELFEIRDATLNNGVFPFKERREIWLFVTENKQADREQYVDKLVGDTLYWQGQRMGRTDSLVIEHKLNGERLMLFYRKAKYEFEGAAFKYEGVFDYVSSSGSGPTSFVLRRAAWLDRLVALSFRISHRTDCCLDPVGGS